MFYRYNKYIIYLIILLYIYNIYLYLKLDDNVNEEIIPFNDNEEQNNNFDEDNLDLSFANFVDNYDLEETSQSPEEVIITSSQSNQPQSLKHYYQSLFKQMPSFWSYNSISSDQIANFKLPIAQKFQPYTDDEKQLIRYLYEESNTKTSKGNTINWSNLHKMYIYRCKQFHFFKPEFEFYFREREHFMQSSKKIIKSK